MTDQTKIVKRKYRPIGNNPLQYGPPKFKQKSPVGSLIYTREKVGVIKDGCVSLKDNYIINYNSINYQHISSIVPYKQKIIIDDDDRVSVDESKYPYKAICLLLIDDISGSHHWGTGFFISDKCIITAGHCVFHDRNWVKNITIIPGGLKTAIGEDTSDTFQSVLGWTNYEDANYDHGAIFLNSDTLFKKVQSHLNFMPCPDTKIEIEISGYPMDKDGEQYMSRGSIISCTSFRMNYNLDTVEGDSGSPVFFETDSKANVIGLHTFGDKPNSALKLNDEVIQVWNDWIKL